MNEPILTQPMFARRAQRKGLKPQARGVLGPHDTPYPHPPFRALAVFLRRIRHACFSAFRPLGARR